MLSMYLSSWFDRPVNASQNQNTSRKETNFYINQSRLLRNVQSFFCLKNNSYHQNAIPSSTISLSLLSSMILSHKLLLLYTIHHLHSGKKHTFEFNNATPPSLDSPPLTARFFFFKPLFILFTRLYSLYPFFLFYLFKKRSFF